MAARKRKDRAGCIPVCIVDSQLLVLLVRSRKHPEHFTFPAGKIEPGESSEDAALRETVEEAGVTGRLGRLLGVEKDGKSQTWMYALMVEREESEYAESTWRDRQWYALGTPPYPTDWTDPCRTPPLPPLGAPAERAHFPGASRPSETHEALTAGGLARLLSDLRPKPAHRRIFALLQSNLAQLVVDATDAGVNLNPSAPVIWSE